MGRSRLGQFRNLARHGFKYNLYKHVNYAQTDPHDIKKDYQGIGTVLGYLLLISLIVLFFVYQIFHKTAIVHITYNPTYADYDDMLNKAGTSGLADKAVSWHFGGSKHPIPVCPCTDQSVKVRDFSALTFAEHNPLGSEKVVHHVGEGGRWKSIQEFMGAADHRTSWYPAPLLYFFKGEDYWSCALSPSGDESCELSANKSVAPKWSSELEGIDTAFTGTDGKTYFLKKDKYWLWDDAMGRVAKDYLGGGKSISSQWPGLPDSIDAAVTTNPAAFLPNNGRLSSSTSEAGKTHFFKGNKYWRWDESSNKPEAGFEHGKNISASDSDWKGLPADMDEAVVLADMYYFIKGDQVWNWDTEKRAIAAGYPKKISGVWKGLPSGVTAAFVNSSSYAWSEMYAPMGFIPGKGTSVDRFFEPDAGWIDSDGKRGLGADSAMMLGDLLVSSRKTVNRRVSKINNEVLSYPLVSGGLMTPQQLQKVTDDLLGLRQEEWELELRAAYSAASDKMSNKLAYTAVEDGLFEVNTDSPLERMMVFAETRNTTRFPMFLARGHTMVLDDRGEKKVACKSIQGQTTQGVFTYTNSNPMNVLIPCHPTRIINGSAVSPPGAELTWFDFPCVNITKDAYVGVHGDLPPDHTNFGVVGAEWVDYLQHGPENYGNLEDCYLKVGGDDNGGGNGVGPGHGRFPFAPFARDPDFADSPNPQVTTDGVTPSPDKPMTSLCEVLDTYFSKNYHWGGGWSGICLAYPMHEQWAKTLEPFNGSMWTAWTRGWSTEWNITTNHSRYFEQCKPMQCSTVEVEGQAPVDAIFLTIGVIASLIGGIRLVGAVVIQILHDKAMREEEQGDAEGPEVQDGDEAVQQPDAGRPGVLDTCGGWLRAKRDSVSEYVRTWNVKPEEAPLLGAEPGRAEVDAARLPDPPFAPGDEPPPAAPAQTTAASPQQPQGTGALPAQVLVD